jgi:tetratricopeptide (TPR) repeat protein
MPSRFSKIAPLILALILILLIGMPVMAQNRIIKGKVINDKGQPVSGAEIKIQGTDVKREYSVKTDKKGEYFYMGIPYGQYRVVVRAKDYQPDFVQGVQPSISEERVVDFSLKPGPDRKLPFEMSTAEMEKLKQESAKADKQKQSSVEVKAEFDAGLALVQQGKDAEAQGKDLEANGKKDEAQGKYSEAQSKYAGGVEAFKKALEKDTDQPYVQANMADALSKLNKNEEALAAYQKAIALKPDDGAMYTNMGVLLGKMGKTAESQEAFKKAAAVNPGAAGQNFYNLGATLVNSGKAAEAADAFRQAIQSDPNFAEAYYQLGICLSGNQATMPEAIKSLQKYIEIGQKADQVEVAKQLITALGAPTGERVIKDEKKKKP